MPCSTGDRHMRRPHTCFCTADSLVSIRDRQSLHTFACSLTAHLSKQCGMQAVGQLCSRHSRGAEHLRRGHVSDAAAAQPAQQTARQRSRSAVPAGSPQAAAASSQLPATRRPAVSLRIHPRRLCQVSHHSSPHNAATMVFPKSECILQTYKQCSCSRRCAVIRVCHTKPFASVRLLRCLCCCCSSTAGET